MSRTKRGNMATLKPASPLRPKTALKTPISHPQRRWRFQTTGPPGRQSQAAVPAGPEAMSSPVISHLDPLTRTSARRHARGPYNPHVNPIICAWAAPPTCMSRGLRAHQRVNVHVQGLTCERRTMPGTVVPKTQTTSHTTPHFHRFLPRWSALWASLPSIGGIALHEAPSDPFKRPASPSIGGICTTWGSDTPATRLQRASCSAKPPTSTGMEGAGGTAGLGRGALGWRGPVGERADAPNHTPAHPAPPVWRAPEGPEGTGGLRGAVPNEVRSPSLAGGRALRRPQHPWGHKQTSNNQRQTATRSVL